MSQATEFEEEVAEMFGGRMTVSSGRMFYDKGDGTCGMLDCKLPLLWDCKTTAQPSYRLTQQTWRKLLRDAVGTGREAVLMLRFLSHPKADDMVVAPTMLNEVLGFGTGEVKAEMANSYAIMPVEEPPYRIIIGPYDLTLHSMMGFGGRWDDLCNQK